MLTRLSAALSSASLKLQRDKLKQYQKKVRSAHPLLYCERRLTTAAVRYGEDRSNMCWPGRRRSLRRLSLGVTRSGPLPSLSLFAVDVELTQAGVQPGLI